MLDGDGERLAAGALGARGSAAVVVGAAPGGDKEQYEEERREAPWVKHHVELLSL